MIVSIDTIKVSVTLQDRSRADRYSAFIFSYKSQQTNILWKLLSPKLWRIPLKISKS